MLQLILHYYYYFIDLSMHTSVKMYDNNYSQNKRSGRTDWYRGKKGNFNIYFNICK